MQKRATLGYDYVRGLAEGEGTFTFSSFTNKLTGECRKVPAFAIKMHVRDKVLLEKVRDILGITNKIYVYNHQGKDGYIRGPQAMLIIREYGTLKNIIIPFFYGKLYGNKANQFEAWLERIGDDPSIPKSYKLLYQLYKSGFYDRKMDLYPCE
ncbi:MAG: LAGLIDADG family homing endonuclease [Candidatus Liptonbacteria bacterium]|nr:LAGLIDADG family homing endonuclease [Candidatus Liptonbacteria bacterium]